MALDLAFCSIVENNIMIFFNFVFASCMTAMNFGIFIESLYIIYL